MHVWNIHFQRTLIIRFSPAIIRTLAKSKPLKIEFSARSLEFLIIIRYEPREKGDFYFYFFFGITDRVRFNRKKRTNDLRIR